MPTSTVTSKGQTTIPKSIRERFRLHPGTKIDFIIRADGSLTVQPVSIDVRELSGILTPRKPRRVTLDKMDRAIAAGAARGVERQ